MPRPSIRAALLALLVLIGLVGGAFFLFSDQSDDPQLGQTTPFFYAPQLISPLDGLQTYPTDIIIEWYWPQGLAENQLFNVRFWREGDPPADVAYTADTQISIQGFLESGLPGRYYWQIAVIQLNAAGVFDRLASGWSPVWQIDRIPPSPIPTETPEPTPTFISPTPNPQYTDPDPYNRPENDVDALMRLNTARQAEAKRAELITILWGEAGLPTDKLPSDVAEAIQDERFNNLPNLRQIDRLTIPMDLEIISYPYIFHPQNDNGRLIIYHHGNDGGFEIGFETIKFFLDAGYTVMAFSMPLIGDNNNPIVEIPALGRVQLPGYLHFHMRFVEPLITEGIALKLFIEPVIVGLNYADTLGFNEYAIVGISGGGWTAHLSAALDPRITRSYPVAGSVPLFQRFEGRAVITDLNAYVQELPGLFPAVNYLELYLLGGFGAGRKQLMIVNQYDPCCFWGVRHEVWYEAVQARMADLGGGRFELFLDDTHFLHIISPAALGVILNDLE